MLRFIIERDLPGVGQLTPNELQAFSQKSCDVLRSMGPRIQWIQSFVTDDKIYCEYLAPDIATLREHATRGGFSVTRISEVRARIDPTTADVTAAQPSRIARAAGAGASGA